jgi:two-component system LytT family response regulator
MAKIRTLIVDDELQARKGIRTLLAKDSDIEVVGECSNGEQAIEQIARLTPDLVLLDVQMPDKNGFEVLEAIDMGQAPTLIFITAYDDYTLRAFEVNALDYLLKPFSDERFYQSVARAKEHHRRKQAQELNDQLLALIEHYHREERVTPAKAVPQAAGPVKRFLIKSGGEVRFVPVDEVSWLEAVGYYTKIHTGGRSHLLRGNLGSIEAQLDPKMFTRIHRSTVVNLSRVKSLRNWFHGDCMAVLQDGTELRVSRSHRRRLETLLEQLA